MDKLLSLTVDAGYNYLSKPWIDAVPDIIYATTSPAGYLCAGILHAKFELGHNLTIHMTILSY